MIKKILDKLTYLVAISVVLVSTFIYIEISEHASPDPAIVIKWILIDLVILLIFVALLTRNFFHFWIFKKYYKGPSIYKNIITTFSIVIAVLATIITASSTYLFNFGVQSWFDNKITSLLEQSVKVAESYIEEHTAQIKNTALFVANDLSSIYYELVHNPILFQHVINAQAQARSLDEALVFQKNTNTVLAQSTLTFSLIFTTIPLHIIERADKGEIVLITSEATKIRVLIKLKEYGDTYLLIGRLVDKKIIDHIDKVHGAAQKYQSLKNNIIHLQIQFSLIFVTLSLILLITAIALGAWIARGILKPINQLVHAATLAKEGDLTVQVPESDNKDEIAILSSIFNKMIKQIHHQQQDLIIAQRALAWSDIARQIAHEIKNPLTPITLAAERLISKYQDQVDDPSSFKRYVEIIQRHTNDIRKIISEFVHFARLPRPHFEKFNIVKAINAIIESRKIIHENVHYAFNSNVETLDFIGDNTQINQVMINLLKNAEESFDSNQQNKNITVDLKQEDNHLHIRVIDNGKGFAPNIISKATEAYFTTRPQGTGLGLAIVMKIVQDHQGKINIQSLDKGSCIHIFFEMVSSDQAERGA